MHIPDGFLDTKTWVTAAVASSVTIGYGIRKVNKDTEEKDLPLMGVLAAFVFAAQMVNFPVAGGTSGHFIGGALTAILLGPWKAMLIMTSVLTVQAFLFGDGGVTALGANILSMGITAPLAAYGVYRLLRRINTPVAVFIAGFASTIATALVTTVELAVSGTAPFLITASLMVGWHVLIGAGEGLITLVTVGQLFSIRPYLANSRPELDWRAIFVLAAIAVFLAVFLSPVASSLPDGLERVAQDVGFGHNEVRIFRAAISNYKFLNSKSLAGLVGVLTSILVGISTALALRYRRSSKDLSDGISLQKSTDTAEHLHSGGLHAHEHAHGNVIHRHIHYHPPANKRQYKTDGEKNGHQHSHTYSFEIYSYAESVIHRLDARTKTVVFIALILAIVLTPASEILRFGLFLMVIGCLYAVSKIPISFGIKRSLTIVPFVVFAGILLVFMPNRPHPDAYHLGFAQYPISHGGLYLFFNALIKSWLSALVAVLLYSTTPFPKFIKGLEMLRVPRIITMLLSFLYRFMWILTDEVKRMIRARDARTLGRSSRLQNMRIIGQMIGGLFIRSYERAERIHIAMSSRGYTGTINTLDTPALTLNDAAFAFISSGLLAIILIWRF